ncbi:LysR family substrate-binding domain-containing protein [Alteribacillus bidgolensis]|uniref:LysR substrate binding domain-containing protein n=1 Tax=Alteribacillus bidgolensis TaxID=930129 RepID=A0A1G8QQN7_9BACI|nr:LysR family substrate-binding domain-containing protein [Alteribacillus bidgolensis]SDJ07017.1 LysR substrate binding domain-containing protein [Alteribacillus bidgolensis]
MPTPRQIEAFHSKEIGIGFVRPFIADSSISFMSVHQETCVAVIPESHPLAQRSSISMKDLSKEQFILVEREIWPSWHDDILSKCHNAGFNPIIRQHVKEIQTVIGLVASGLGGSIVPKPTAEFHLWDVSYLTIYQDSPHIEMNLSWRSDNNSILVKQFLDSAAQINYWTVKK